MAVKTDNPRHIRRPYTSDSETERDSKHAKRDRIDPLVMWALIDSDYHQTWTA